MKRLINVWSAELKNSGFRVQAVVSFAALFLTLGFMARFLSYVEARPGVTLDDPILSMITPRNLTWLTFALIYAGLAMAIISLSSKPKDFVLITQAYTLMVWIRIGMMSLIPLNAPEGLIVLQDPFVQFVGDGAAPTKDLFFSGHTSTMFLLYLVTKTKWLKATLLGFTLLVAACVIWQHVHYVIDVAVAPFVSYGAYRMALLVNRKNALPVARA